MQEYLIGKNIPADIDAFICRMIVCVFFRFSHVDQQSCQIPGVCGRSDLVIDNAEGVILSADIQHGSDKIAAVGAKDPGNPDKKVFPADRQRPLF